MFVFGCDLDGRSVWQLLAAGGRITLFIAGVTVLLSSSLGVLLGALSGYFGGWLDAMIMRVVDIVLSVPQILLALVVISVLGPSHANVILVLIATGWAPSARLVRAQVLSVKEREFVKAAEAFGASIPRVFLKHLLPQALSPLLVHATFSAAAVIIVESSLSFLGLSANSEIPTWGGLLNQGKSVMFEAPHLSVFPGLVIMLFVLSLNFIGDALRDELDPRSEIKKV
jgi:peptide/nickel transport system permease protein